MRVPSQISRAINRFDTACQDRAFVGAAHPDDMPGIEQEYEHARDLLEQTISRALTKAKQND